MAWPWKPGQESLAAAKMQSDFSVDSFSSSTTLRVASLEANGFSGEDAGFSSVDIADNGRMVLLRARCR